MKEIGGYIEFEHFHGDMLHENAIALNCGRNCLAYLFKSKKINKLRVPYFICNSILDVCNREGVKKVFYHIDKNFVPIEDFELEDEEWLYLVNFYGQLSNEDISGYVKKYVRVIVDQANGFFEKPLPGVDTFYTCRKWFGVADGAFLYTDTVLEDEFPMDESYDRMHFLLGRYEKTASEFYGEYNDNNKFFAKEPIKQMSKLTRNILHGIDYGYVENKRKDNFAYLNRKLGARNLLQIKDASFMYPFMVENGEFVREMLRSEKIYIPTLWPAVLDITFPGELENEMVKNILPLPVDQRYGKEDMDYLIEKIEKYLEVV